jgi:hypothetical protein
MSVVKRYFNKKSILSVYKLGGAESVIAYIKRADVCYMEDSFSSEINEAIINKDFELVATLLNNESVQLNTANL